MKIFAAILIILVVIVVVKLIDGVQKAKRNGTYLQPDNLKEYGVTPQPRESELVTDEQGDNVSF